MAKRGVEEQISALSQLRGGPVTEATLAALRKGLSDRVNLVCAKAAQVAGEIGAHQLIPELAAAFERSFRNRGEADQQCWAKIAIAAIVLRSLCTLALVQCADLPRAAKLRHLVVSMTDKEETVRIDAIRAIEQMEGEEAALLLRLKAALGDQRAVVTGQALESLLRVEGERGLDFAREFLLERTLDNPREVRSTPEEAVEEAALALGASRLPGAVDALKEAWRQVPKLVYLQAISASRQESGFAFLLELVTSGRERDAAAAVDALALNRDSPEVRSRGEAAVQARNDIQLSERFRTKFCVR
jgi:HEAT repeat protein